MDKFPILKMALKAGLIMHIVFWIEKKASPMILVINFYSELNLPIQIRIYRIVLKYHYEESWNKKNMYEWETNNEHKECYCTGWRKQENRRERERERGKRLKLKNKGWEKRELRFERNENERGRENQLENRQTTFYNVSMTNTMEVPNFQLLVRTLFLLPTTMLNRWSQLGK